MFAELLILFTCISSIYWYFLDRPPSGKRLPGPVSIPFFGSSIQIGLKSWKRNYEMLEEFAQKYGSMYGFRTGVQYFVSVNDIRLAKQIMSSEDFSSRVPPNEFIFERSFGKNLGLIWSHGESWKQIRRYTVKTMRQFGFGKGATMETFLEEESEDFLLRFDKARNENNNTVYVHQLFNITALNLTWSMIAGIRFSFNDETFNEFLETIDVMQKEIVPISSLPAFPFLRYIPGLTEHDLILKVHRKLQSMFKEIVDQRREKGTYHDNPSDFLEVFIKEIDLHKNDKPDNIYTEEQLLMVCIDLFFTSSDTTSAALEFGLLYMLLNPEVMVKVQQEIDTVVGPDRHPNLDDRLNMPYLEATMLEVLRYSSINPIAGRSPNNDCFINGYYIPKNATFAINLHSIHFNKEIWGDPIAFRPERFLDCNNKIINSDKVLAFGYGKRVCIGETLARATFFTFFTTILQKYSIEKSPAHPEPTTEPRTGITSTAQPFYLVAKLRRMTP